MANEKKIRLNGVAKQLNVGTATIIDFLNKKNTDHNGPSTAIDSSTYALLIKEFGKPNNVEKVNIKAKIKSASETVSLNDIDDKKHADIVVEEPKTVQELFIKDNSLKTDATSSSNNLKGPKILGKIELPETRSHNKSNNNSTKREHNSNKGSKSERVAKTGNATKPENVTKPANVQNNNTETKSADTNPKKEVKQQIVTNKEQKPAEQQKVTATVQQTKTTTTETQTNSDLTKTFDERLAADDTNLYRGTQEKLSGPKIIGKIDLNAFEKKKPETQQDKRNKRKRIKKDGKVDVNDPKLNNNNNNQHNKQGGQNRNNNNQGGGQNRNNNNQHGGQGGQNRNNNNQQGGQNNNQGGGQNRNNNNQHGGQGGQRNNNQHSGQGGQNRNNNQHGGQGGQNRNNNNRPGGNANNNYNNAKKKGKAPIVKAEVTDEEVQKQIKDTLARLTSKGNKTKSSKYRRDKREAINQRINEEQERQEQERNTLKLTEFVTVSDLAKMMDVQVTEIITACMNLGLMVSINQRLDAEALVVVAEEFGFKCEFVSVEIQESITADVDKEEDLLPRSPIVTVMGHVDHGKTSLLDFIRKSKVIEGEAGGITQHIGAYSVKIEDGRRITFLDTPGHEAFTAMRARGASVTDIAIIIIAADDSVMPQTIEAINHASAAGVPIVFAINKIDKPGANPDKIREQLGAMNYLVEEWGGKYQCQEVAAKQGLNVDLLLEKVLLEAELLELKANPNKRANGVVIESSLDKGRGYTSTVLVQGGTLKIGDTMLSGIHTGRVKAMFNERGKRVTEAAPATPVLVLGLNGAPQAGDAFNIMEDDKSARDLANKREQLQRMQGLKTQKHITLDEIGRRIAIGNFQELNVIVKGDVDGSVEALTDSLIKQSKEEVQVNVIHKAVGQISESDVLLAAASNAVIIGFQVRPSVSARRLAEKEEIEIRTYSIIYDAINEIKDAIEGMLAPQYREEVVCSVEIMETFKITKVGTIAGCLVREGKIKRETKVRVIRDGIVVYTGKLASLKRYKDDAKEVVSGLECGLNIENYNDIHVGDIVEGYDQIEVKRK